MPQLLVKYWFYTYVQCIYIVCILSRYGYMNSQYNSKTDIMIHISKKFARKNEDYHFNSASFHVGLSYNPFLYLK